MNPSRLVCITGASRGIGLAIARKFHKNGFSLRLHASSELSLQGLKSEFPEAELFAADLKDSTAISELAQQWSSLPAPEILINNAGTFLPGAIFEEKPGVFETLVSVNLAAPYHLTRALLPGMMSRKSGIILNMCSTASLQGYPNGGSYCITKFALLGFSKELREELKPYGIKVISMMPGATYTDSWAGSGLPEDRFISANDLAELVYTSCTLSSSAVVEEIIIRPLLGDIGN
jgi:short-subunit dehydrogenase